MLKRCEFFVGERLWLESAAGCGNDRADSAATDELASATPDEPTIDEPNATVSINRKESTSEALWLSYSADQANGQLNWRRGFAGTRLLRREGSASSGRNAQLRPREAGP